MMFRTLLIIMVIINVLVAAGTKEAKRAAPKKKRNLSELKVRHSYFNLQGFPGISFHICQRKIAHAIQ